MSEDKPAITRGSKNVFADLGLPNADALLAKSELAAQILKIVRARRLTQTQAGELLGLAQPKVSALLNGRLDGFSTDRLIRCLINLGWDVQIQLSKTEPQRRGRVQVTTGR